MLRILATFIFVFCFSGCSLFIEKVPPLKLNLNPPPPLQLKKIEFIVITKESSQIIFDLAKNESDYVIIGLTDEGYRNLSLNLRDIANYIIYQNKVISSYKDFYEKTR